MYKKLYFLRSILSLVFLLGLHSTAVASFGFYNLICSGEEGGGSIPAPLIPPNIDPSPKPTEFCDDPDWVCFFFKNTTTKSDDEVYILFTGSKEKDADGKQEDASFLEINSADGTTSLVKASEVIDNGKQSIDYSKKFSELFEQGGWKLVKVKKPTYYGARVYFSLGSPLYLKCTKGGGASTYDTISDPSLERSDPNYYVLYDKIEFTLEKDPEGDQIGDQNLNINTTAVDFFSLPITIRMTQVEGSGILEQSGLSVARSNVIGTNIRCGFTAFFKSYDFSTYPSLWKKSLFQEFLSNPYPFNDPSPQEPLTTLRVLSPGKGIDHRGTYRQFPKDYLTSTNYLLVNFADSVWNLYKSRSLNIDTRVSGKGKFSGGVSDTTLTLTNDNNDTWVSTYAQWMNSSSPFFNGTGFSTNDEAFPEIPQAISSAFDVGFLPLPVQDVSEDEFFSKPLFQAHQEIFYKNNANVLPPSHPFNPGTGQGPIYDLYSRTLHKGFASPSIIYSFPYDDLLGIDSTLQGNTNSVAEGGLNSQPYTELFPVEGNLPDFKTDNTQYTIETFTAAESGDKVYYSTDNGVSWTEFNQGGGAVENISFDSSPDKPFQISFAAAGTNVVKMYLKYDVKIPCNAEFTYSSAIKVTFTSSTTLKIEVGEVN